jgi:hypothetical protein
LGRRRSTDAREGRARAAIDVPELLDAARPSWRSLMRARRASLVVALLALLAAGCTSQQKSSVTTAATMPLSDLNVVRADIPPLLDRARHAPYAMPSDTSCDALDSDIEALDDVLGPDLDAPRSTDRPSLLERGTTAAGNEAVGALKGAAQGVVPFRHWVRQLTGAERYSNKVAAAIIAGTERRSFLKGLRAAFGCPAPPGASTPAAVSPSPPNGYALPP